MVGNDETATFVIERHVGWVRPRQRRLVGSEDRDFACTRERNIQLAGLAEGDSIRRGDACGTGVERVEELQIGARWIVLYRQGVDGSTAGCVDRYAEVNVLAIWADAD